MRRRVYVVTVPIVWQEPIATRVRNEAWKCQQINNWQSEDFLAMFLTSTRFSEFLETSDNIFLFPVDRDTHDFFFAAFKVTFLMPQVSNQSQGTLKCTT